MATITQRPDSYVNPSSNGFILPEKLTDSSSSTYAYGNDTNATTILLYYNFTSIPANALVTAISTTIKYQCRGTISYRLCKDSTASTSGNYTIIADSYTSAYNNTSTRSSATETFSEPDSIINAINSDIGILRTSKRFSLRLYGKAAVADSANLRIYDIPVTITYALPHTISTNVSPSGCGSVSGGGTYYDGSSVTLTAMPATGYQFTKWQKNGTDDGNTSATRTITISEDATYTAVFVASNYTISTSVSPTGTGTVSGAGSYASGASATLTATPSNGYQFVKWQKNGTDDGNTSATRTITVSEDATYTAVFQGVSTTVTFNASGGSISISSKSVTYGSAYGTLPTPTRAGYTFAGWYTSQPVYNGGFLRNNSDIALGRTYMYTDKISVKVFAYMENWEDIVNKNIISCTEGGGWGIGYLANTTGHGTEIYIDGIGYKGIDFNIASLSSGWHCFDMVFDGSNFIGYVDGTQKGIVSTGGTAIKYHASNGIFIGSEAGSGASAGTGGYFNSSLGSVFITNTNAMLAEVTSGSTVSNSSAHTLYAAWKINHYTTTATCSNGTINGMTSYSSVNPYGEQITLSASPATGYTFTSWGDGNTSASRNITVQQNASYTATFTINSYSISKSLSHATLSNSNTTIQHGSSYSSTVTADTNYAIDTVTVMMGGTDITSTAYSNGAISIASVTGNISITVTTASSRLPEVASVSVVPNPANAGQGLVFTVVFS